MWKIVVSANFFLRHNFHYTIKAFSQRFSWLILHVTNLLSSVPPFPLLLSRKRKNQSVISVCL
jgi:hypothetical protein